MKIVCISDKAGYTRKSRSSDKVEHEEVRKFECDGPWVRMNDLLLETFQRGQLAWYLESTRHLQGVESFTLA